MSILLPLEAEMMLMAQDKEYKRSVKNRLKELIEEGDEEAALAYELYFPKLIFGEKCIDIPHPNRIHGRQHKTIPHIICRCKNCLKTSDKVTELESVMLDKEQRKTWGRLIKPNLRYLMSMNGRERRNRRIFFSYEMMPCIEKKHKLGIRFIRNGKTIAQMGFAYK